MQHLPNSSITVCKVPVITTPNVWLAVSLLVKAIVEKLHPHLPLLRQNKTIIAGYVMSAILSLCYGIFLSIFHACQSLTFPVNLIPSPSNSSSSVNSHHSPTALVLVFESKHHLSKRFYQWLFRVVKSCDIKLLCSFMVSDSPSNSLIYDSFWNSWIVLHLYLQATRPDQWIPLHFLTLYYFQSEHLLTWRWTLTPNNLPSSGPIIEHIIWLHEFLRSSDSILPSCQCFPSTTT